MAKDRRVSRRFWLTQAALTAMPPLAPSTSSAQGKASKSVVHYRDYPKDRQMCGMCKFFEGSEMMGGGMMGSGMGGGGMMGRGMMAGECEVVEGRISPMGWCDLYAPRNA
jgi:hypothetical protein